MEIKYMKQLQENPNLHKEDWSKNRPMDLTEISKLETTYNNGKAFPKAFREYLFLAGNGSAIGVVDHDFDNLYSDCKEDMAKFGYKLNRPYFVFDNFESQYGIFYLDEEREDPKIYILDPYGKKRGEFSIVREDLQGTFTNLINQAIFRIKNNIPF